MSVMASTLMQGNLKPEVIPKLYHCAAKLQAAVPRNTDIRRLDNSMKENNLF
jgi:hypothetical protein